MKKSIYAIVVAGLLLLAVSGYAANPLVTNVRTADANPLVYNDTFYIVCGQDEVNATGFDMYAWRLLSSTNMRDWTDHGQILRPDQVSWMPDNRAWASSLVYRNGYFYLYTANDWQVGVMRATSITGPYSDVLGHALIDSSTPGHAARDIDPQCYIDDDGQAYLFWGGDGNCRYARLNSDMISLATSVMDVPGLTSYLEAPFVIKTNGYYFLMYADSPWPSEIRYATSTNIAGPWSYRGVIGTPTGSGTNHEGAAYYKNQWWYTYHTEELSNNNPYSRSVCVDKMYINGNTIQSITYTDNNGGGVDDSTIAPTSSATVEPSTPPADTPVPTTPPVVTAAPTDTPAPTSIPTATPAGVTADPTAAPGDTLAPTSSATESPSTPPAETTPPAGCTCTNLCSSQTAISVPFTKDGTGEFCYTASSLGSYVNSWNTDAVNINGTNCTNTYTTSSTIPAIGGIYYIYYKGSYSWSHLEIK